MLFEFIILLALILLIVSNVWLARKIPNDKTIKMIEKTDRLASKALEVTQIYINSNRDFHQLFNKLDDKMDALSRFVDAHSTNAIFQQEQFNTLIKSDMLAARREELRRLKELKIALERLMGVALTSRQPPSPNDVLELENIQRRIEELESLV